MTRRRGSRVGHPTALLAAGLLLALPGAALAQEAANPAPLSKGAVVRLLTAGTYDEDEIVGIVRRGCLTFTPTERDLRDFRSLGATAPVVNALRTCASEERAASAAPVSRQAPAERRPRAPTPAPAVVTTSISPSRLSFPVGGAGQLAVEVRAGDRPVAGTRVVLAGTDRIRGGAGRDLSNLTDEDGRVTFLVPAGTSVGTYALRLEVPGRTVQGATRLLLDVRPGPPARAEVSPGTLILDPDEEPGDLQLRAILRDRYGNRIPDADLALVPVAPRDGEPERPRAEGRTDELGEAALFLDRRDLRPGDVLALRSGEDVLAVVPVSSSEGAAAGAAARAGDREDEFVSASSAERPPRRNAARDRPGADRRRAEGVPGSTDRAPSDEELARLEATARGSPTDASAWLALGKAYAARGDGQAAREAYKRGLEANPKDRATRSELVNLLGLPPALEMMAWGGGTLDAPRRIGLRAARLTVSPYGALRAWLLYDHAMTLDVPFLARGPEEPESVYAGLAVSPVELSGGYQLGILAEAGRRAAAPDLAQYTYRLEPLLGFPTSRGPLHVRVGGLLGRWFDRDDWVVYTRVGIPVLDELRLTPALYFGETVGSDVAVRGRVADREVRGYLEAQYRSPLGIVVEPAVGIGSVESDAAEFSGTLMDYRVLLGVPIGGPSRLLFHFRHQSPPGRESFRSIAVGLSLGVERDGF